MKIFENLKIKVLLSDKGAKQKLLTEREKTEIHIESLLISSKNKFLFSLQNILLLSPQSHNICHIYTYINKVKEEFHSSKYKGNFYDSIKELN